MAIGREFYQLLRLYGGLALEYQDLTETDFASAAGIAYTPPEEGSFRRIAGARTLQLLSQCPGVVETFQTSAATVRLPANTVSESTNDSANGRVFIVKNSGSAGSVTISDYLGNTQFVLLAGLCILVVGNNNNTWDFLFTGLNTWFNPSNTPSLGFTSTSVQGAIEELATRTTKIKTGTVSPGSFAGTPKKYTVTFTTAFSNSNYSIEVTGTDNRNWSWESKTAASFVINSNAGAALGGNVDWQCIPVGEIG